jgi:hypothetical protein
LFVNIEKTVCVEIDVHVIVLCILSHPLYGVPYWKYF